MATTAAVLDILVNAQTGKATAELKSLDKTLQKTGDRAHKSSGRLGKGLKVAAIGAAAGFAAVAYEATRAYKAYEESYKVGKQTEAAIKSTGGAAKVSAKHVGDLANAISLKTGIDDEAIQSGENLLLTFKNIKNGVGKSNKVFDQTSRAIVDMSVAMDQDMKSSAIQVGKALNDPIKGLTALSRVGVTFTEGQKEQITRLTENGERMKAQKIILKELNSEFGGSAAAVATPMDKAKVAVENLEEALGKVLFPTVGKIAEAVAGFVNQMQNGTGAGGKFKEVVVDIAKKVGAAYGVWIAWIKGAIQTVKQFLKTEEWKSWERAAVKAAKVVSEIFQRYLLPIIKTVFESIIRILRDFGTIIKGVIRVISGVINGEWGKAWQGVKDIFRGGVDGIFAIVKGITKPLRTVAAAIGGGISDAFAAAWKGIKSVFVSGANTVIDVVNAIISAINFIPGVPNIDTIGHVGASGKPKSGEDVNGKSLGRARGGPIDMGAPSGDTVPAMLEKGEYVLNRKAVAAVGKGQLDMLNFKHAPRFAGGGGVLGDIASLPGKAIGAASDVIGKGAGFFIGNLPHPNIPEPFSGLGSYLIDTVTDWIKNGFSSGKLGSRGGGGGGPVPPGFDALLKHWNPEAPRWDVWQVGKLLASMGYAVGENPHFGGVQPVHADNSYHYSGRAIDVNADTMPGGEKVNLDRLYGQLQGIPHTELLWQVADHYDHLHYAYKKGGLVGQLARMASGGVVGTVGTILGRNGLDLESTAGILGNAWQESGWNPAAMEPGTHNGGLWGFTASPVSLSDVEAYASSQGKPWTSAAIQTQFLLHNLSSGLKSKMNAASSLSDTTSLFMNEWERPYAPTANLPRRIEGAERAYRMLKGDFGGGGGSSSKPKAAPRLADVFGNAAVGRPAGKLKRKLEKIKGLGLSSEMLGKLGGLSGDVEQFSEFADNASSIGGPFRGGTEGEWLTKQLDTLFSLRNYLIRAHEQIVKRRDQITEMLKKAREQLRAVESQLKEAATRRKKLEGQLKAAKATGDPAKIAHAAGELDVLGLREADAKGRKGGVEKVIAALVSQRSAANTTRGEILGEGGDRFFGLTKLQGSNGPLELMSKLTGIGALGGDILSTQLRLRDLGSSTDSTDSSGRITALEDMLRFANQRNLVFERQSPIVGRYAGMFAAGGRIPRGQWGIAGEAGPEIVHGPAQVYSNRESAGMGGVNVQVVVHDGAVDTSKIQVIANGEAVRVSKAQGRASKLRNPRAGRGV